MMAKQKIGDEVILQFFEDYDMEVTLHSRNADGSKNPVVEDSFTLTGKLKSPKNITIISKELYEKALAGSKPFSSWVKIGTLLILDNVPTSYYDATELAAESQAKVAKAEGLLSQKEVELKAKDEEIEKLRAELKGYGARGK